MVVSMLTLAACGGGGGAAPAGPPDGEAVFNRSCAACHGVDGGGGIGLNLQGVHDRLTPVQIDTVIREGRNTMPAWEGRLDDEEIRAVVRHLETFG